MAEAYIVAAARTAGGRRGGRLSNWHPVDLAAEVINAVVDRSGVDPAAIDDVIMGCVDQAGAQAGNIGRMAVLASKLPESVPGVAIDRQCGSSQQAVHFAAQAVMSGTMDIVMAAGVEVMSLVPIGASAKIGKDAGMGYFQSPNINRKYNNFFFSQFAGAELMAKKYELSKDDLDRFALESHQRAIAATKAGAFKDEIVPVQVRTADGKATDEMHTVDEGIRFDATLAGIQGVKLLQEGGCITAATASQICDGAAAILVVNERGLKTLGVEPLARIHQMSVIGSDPVMMLAGPIPATELALKKAGMKIDDIDLYEVNEAFAPVPLGWMKAVHADPARLNVHGGAIALGHPLGCTGAKLMTTLINALKQQGKRYGLQTMCEGGGTANATIIERL
ncbi:MAG: acetyl-CoA C-acyltransferase [Burkholderiaceae bacterium]|nr:MAG: acetyl-CoA C-acyltransferase [Burkholderiaceae bacterium]